MLNKRLAVYVISLDGMLMSLKTYVDMTYEEFVKGCVCGDFDNREFHYV